jgi:hypothetical protein
MIRITKINGKPLDNGEKDNLYTKFAMMFDNDTVFDNNVMLEFLVEDTGYVYKIDGKSKKKNLN